MDSARHRDLARHESPAESENATTATGRRGNVPKSPATKPSGNGGRRELAHQAEVLAVLYNLTDRLHRAETREAVYAAAMDAMFEGLACDRASILLFDRSGPMHFVAWRRLSETYRKAVEGHSPWQRNDIDARPIFISDLDSSDLDAGLNNVIRREGIRALCFFPLIAEAQVIGKFMAYYDRPRSFDRDAVELGLTIARQLAFALSRMAASDARRRYADVQQHLASIVEHSDDAIISKDTNGTVLSWNRGAERLFGYRADEIVGKNITTIIPRHLLGEEPDILRRIRAGERIDHYETQRRHRNGTLIDISLTVSPMWNARGEIVAASKIMRDISRHKKAEAQHNLLIAELNHRVKNTLATVVSIARQSFSGPEMREARGAFNARIRGLAQSHARLAEANWTSVELQTLFEDEFTPYRESGNVRLSGPPVALAPKSALTLGLAVHELATNAAKYGALAKDGGVVDVRWTVDPDDSALSIFWAERGGPQVSPPARSGFGRLLLERAVAEDLKSKVALAFEPQGLRFTAVIPAVQYQAQIP